MLYAGKGRQVLKKKSDWEDYLANLCMVLGAIGLFLLIVCVFIETMGFNK